MRILECLKVVTLTSTMLTLPAVLGGCGGSSSSGSSASVNQTGTLDNLHTLGVALIEYEQDSDELLPVAQDTQALIPKLMPYTHDSSVFVDPNTNMQLSWNASLSGTSIILYPDFSKIVAFYDASPPVVEARPVGLLDAQAELVTDAQWQQLKSASHIPE